MDFATFVGFDWDSLRRASQELLDLARAFRIWLVVDSAHRLSEDRQPHSSVYVIDHEVKVIDRYDKAVCSGDAEGRSGHLAHYSSGDQHPADRLASLLWCGHLAAIGVAIGAALRWCCHRPGLVFAGCLAFERVPRNPARGHPSAGTSFCTRSLDGEPSAYRAVC